MSPSPLSPLPTPNTLSARSTRSSLASNPAFIIPIWIFLSASVITYNNWIYNTVKFKYPVFIVTWHLTFASIGTRVLKRTTNLLDGADHVNMTKDLFTKSILPIGALFSASLVLSNTAYLYLSVAYIQMLKVRPETSLCDTLIDVLLPLFRWRIGLYTSCNSPHLLCGTSTRPVTTSRFNRSHDFGWCVHGILRRTKLRYVRLHRTGVGCRCMCTSHSYYPEVYVSLQFEASRLVMIQILLQGVKMDPLVSLHYYAPVRHYLLGLHSLLIASSILLRSVLLLTSSSYPSQKDSNPSMLSWTHHWAPARSS